MGLACRRRRWLKPRGKLLGLRYGWLVRGARRR